MVAVVSVVLVVLLSVLITRFGAIALALSGMPHEDARFQARAAMHGVGLTTNSPEEITGHPLRRRIVFVLMVLGNAGIVTAMASLVLSFTGGSGGARIVKGAILAAALLALWVLSRTGPVDRAVTRGIERILQWRGFATRDYARLLGLSGAYGVDELHVREDDWLANRSLRDLRLRDEGVMVVGIRRDGQEYIGVPGPETIIRPGDKLVLYGKAEQIAELDVRPYGETGDAAHRRARAAVLEAARGQL